MSKLHLLEKKYIEKYYPLFGSKKVSEKLGRSCTSVSLYARKMNLSIDKTNGIGLEIPDFDVNLNFSSRFANMDEDLAYWLGFMWADGTVNRHSSMVIEIIESDGVSLNDSFMKIFPFSVTTRKRRNKKGQMTFRVCDKDVSVLLESLGKYPHSSESHKKVFEYLQEKRFQVAFLRGLIDGDGNFYLNREEKYGQFTLASNYNQDWSFLKNYLRDFNPSIAKDEDATGKSSILRITGRDNLVNFINFLSYEDNNFGLKRKRDVALEILKLYSDNPPKDWKKHVLQYTKDGDFIKEWKSAFEASKALGINKNGIANCARGTTKSSNGYVWKYKPHYFSI